MKLRRWNVAVAALFCFRLIASPPSEVARESGNSVACYISVLNQVLLLGGGLRAETIESSESYQRRFATDFVATESNLNSSPQFTPEILALWDFTSTAGGHVVSLGSGPDIFRPLFNFPFAKHFHLVDVLQGWHPDPNVAFRELVRRLEHIGPRAEVSMVDEGFLNSNSAADGNRPCTWKVSWDSRFGGRQTRYVSLHRKDYRDITDVGHILAHFGAEKISAIFITRAYLPRGEVLSLFLEKLPVGGVVHADMDFVNSLGESRTPLDFEIRRQMEAEGLKVTDMLPRDPELFQRGPQFFWPNFYRLEKHNGVVVRGSTGRVHSSDIRN